MKPFRLALAALMIGSGLPAFATDITIATPYIASIPTNEMAQAFKKAAEVKGWTVTIIDTRGDFGQLASRMEDAVAAKTSAIVLISTDPAQVGDQVDEAAKAGIPVISLDGSKRENVALNVTSDNFALGEQLSKALFDAMGGKGNIVKFYYSAHPGVHQRELGLDAVLKEYPGIKVIADHYVKVPGPVDDGRVAMENILRQYGDKIDGVWAAWDDPGVGAELAIEADMPESKAIIMGIDGSEQATQMIGDCTHYKATFRQDFPKIAETGVEQLSKVLAGGKTDSDEITIPALRVDTASLGVTCQ